MTHATATVLDSACPECRHLNFVVTEYWPETLVDPACGGGRCRCKELNEGAERLSLCCGAPEHPDIVGFCSKCRDGTGFEVCDCDQPCDCEERCRCDCEGEF